MAKEPYVYTLPEQFLTDTSVPIRWRVWAVINGFFVSGQKCWASNEWLGEKVKAHKDSVSQAIKELENMKMLSCERTRRTRLISPGTSEIGGTTYHTKAPTPILDRRQRLSISDSISDSRKGFLEKQKSSLSEKDQPQTQIETRDVDSDGMPVAPKQRKGAYNRDPVWKIVQQCAAAMQKDTGIPPVMGVKSLVAVKRALKTLKPPDILIMVEDALSNGRAEKFGMSLNAILSDTEINKYMLDNH